jgi:hypothetical protein
MAWSSGTVRSHLEQAVRQLLIIQRLRSRFLLHLHPRCSCRALRQVRIASLNALAVKTIIHLAKDRRQRQLWAAIVLAPPSNIARAQSYRGVWPSEAWRCWPCLSQPVGLMLNFMAQKAK